MAYPIVAPDPSPYADINPGETFFRPPHRLRCIACGHPELLFDPRKHGYDGELGHGSSYKVGEEGEAPIPPGRSIVEVTFTYNTPLDELLEIGTEESLSPSDLFDWIEISCDPGKAEEAIDLSYECA